MPAHRGMPTGQWRAQGIDMGSSSSVASRLLEGGDPVIDQATALLKALANDNRLRILCLLEGQELSVTELNQRLALSQSALSQHLAILRRENLVSTRRASQTIYYSLQGESARTIIDALGRLGLDRVD
jgi:ArsR family transcriptional regulator, virulence genes transcriptional regulator